MTRDRALQKAREIVLAHHHYMCKGCQEMIAAALLDAYADGLKAAGDDLRLRDVDDVRAEAASLRGTT